MFNDKREKLTEIFEDTMRLCRKDTELADAIKHTRENTTFYAPDEKPDLSKQEYTRIRKTQYNVTTERTLEAAKRLSEKYSGKRIAVLNFASATNPGGGVARGSSAQEESFCRCSTLYPCLNLRTILCNAQSSA